MIYHTFKGFRYFLRMDLTVMIEPIPKEPVITVLIVF